MDNHKLQEMVEDISLTFFNKKFNHRATFNNRLRTTGGRYILKTHDIDINPKYYQEHGIDEVIGIIKHELCHYHLHLEGKGYKHGDRDFKELMGKVGAPRFCSPLTTKQKISTKVYLYKCECCEQEYNRKRRVNTKRFVCGKCGGKICLRNKG